MGRFSRIECKLVIINTCTCIPTCVWFCVFRHGHVHSGVLYACGFLHAPRWSAVAVLYVYVYCSTIVSCVM